MKKDLKLSKKLALLSQKGMREQKDRVTVPRYEDETVKEVKASMWCKKCERNTVHYILYVRDYMRKNKKGILTHFVYYKSGCEICWEEKACLQWDKKHITIEYDDLFRLTARDWEAFLKESTW